MGLAAISDRLADVLVPGLRARMQRVRFVTAMAVGAMACETLADELVRRRDLHAGDLLRMARHRRPGPAALAAEIPPGVPGSQKARAVVARRQRLSARRPTSRVRRCSGSTASTSRSPSTPASLAADSSPVRVVPELSGLGVRAGLRRVRRRRARQPTARGCGRSSVTRCEPPCAMDGAPPTRGSWLFGRLAASLHPDTPGPGSATSLRSWSPTRQHETRAELAALVADLDGEVVRSRTPRRRAALLLAGAAAASSTRSSPTSASPRWSTSPSAPCARCPHSMGTQPLTPAVVDQHEMIVRCARELPPD